MHSTLNNDGMLEQLERKFPLDAACFPPSIHLQVFRSSEDTETPIPEDAWGEVTWSQDRVFAGDVQYIRADMVNDLLTALDDCLAIPANVLPAYHKLAEFIPENDLAQARFIYKKYER